MADLDEDEKDDDEEKEEMEADDDDDSGEDEGAAGETPEDKEMDEDAKIAKEYGLDDYDDGNLTYHFYSMIILKLFFAR